MNNMIRTATPWIIISTLENQPIKKGEVQLSCPGQHGIDLLFFLKRTMQLCATSFCHPAQWEEGWRLALV
jgi:hypothetical protein